MKKVLSFFRKNIKIFALSLVAIVFAIAGISSCCFLIPEELESVTATISGKWTDSGNYSSALDGQGTEDSPFLIKNEAQLAYLAVKANAGECASYKYYKLDANLDLSAHEWVPIGNSVSNYFYGNFDFDNFTIKGMNINQNIVDRAGLFGYAGGSFSNLKIYDGRVEKTVESLNDNTLFIGYICEDTEIGNLVVTGKINGPVRSAAAIVGATSYKNLTIKNTFVNIEIESNFVCADSVKPLMGGLVASASYSSLTIDNCRVSGRLINNKDKGLVGGLVASYDGNRIDVKNSTFDGYIKQMSAYPSNSDAVGGIIGFLNCNPSSVIENVSANVQILHNREIYVVDNTEKFNLLHGFVGYADASYRPSTVNNCFYSVKKGKTESELEQAGSIKKFIGDFGGAEQSAWAVVSGLNSGLPILRSQYWIAKKSTDIGQTIVQTLINKGYTESDSEQKIEEFIPRISLYTITTSAAVTSGALDNDMQVTFSSRGISNVTNSSNLVYGQKIVLSYAEVKGYSFLGYTENDASVNRDYVVTKDSEIVGTYSPNDYVITLDVNADNATINARTRNITFATALATLETPARIGYKFGGWFPDKTLSLAVTDENGLVIHDSSDSSGEAIISSSGKYIYPNNLTLYAKWIANKYNITLDMQEGADGTESVTATYDAILPSITIPIRAGYTYEGYFTARDGNGTRYYDENGNGTSIWNIADNITLYAYWSENSSYLLRSWKKVIAKELGDIAETTFRGEIQSVEFTRELPTGETVISVGSLNSSGSESYSATRGIDDVTAYVTESSNNVYDIKIYSPCPIYAPKNCSSLFYNVVNMTSLVFNNFNTKYTTTMYSMFSRCSSLTELDLSGFDTSSVDTLSDMFSTCSKLKTLNLSSFNTSKVEKMSSMFSYCSNLETLNVTSFDTSNVTTMDWMFSSCPVLQAPDVSKFDTSSVTDMSAMFYGCKGLTSLDVSKFDTHNVLNMNSMFNGCSGLTELDVTNFDTSQVTRMSNMFSGCSGLTSLDVSKFDTHLVSSMTYMFSGCSGLTSLYLGNFDTRKVNSLNNLFNNCWELESIDLGNFDTSIVTSMNNMFSGCTRLKAVNLISFDTTKVTSMSSMFYKCSALTSLDLSNFDMSSVTSATNIMYGMSSLNTLQTPKNLTLDISLLHPMYDSEYNQFDNIPKQDTSIEIRRGYTVTLNSNGGIIPSTIGYTGTSSSVTRIVRYGSTYGDTYALPTPTKEGYTFLGWWTTYSGGTKVESSTELTNYSSHTIYAHWQANTYTTSVHNYQPMNAGGFRKRSETTTYGVTITPSADGSYVTLNGTMTDSIILSYIRGATLTAGEKYTLLVKCLGGSYTRNVTNACLVSEFRRGDTSRLGGGTDAERLYDSSLLILPTEGKSWISSKYLTISDQNAKEAELWETWLYRGTQSGDSLGYTFYEYQLSTQLVKVETLGSVNQTYGLAANRYPVPTLEGFTFVGWFAGSAVDGIQLTDSTGSVKRNVSGYTDSLGKWIYAGNANVYSVWTPKTYTLTFNSNSGSSVDSRTYTYNSIYDDLPTPTRTGYTFDGWYGNIDGYTVLDHIEATGTQYIDTGVYTTSDVKVYMDFQFTDLTTQQRAFGHTWGSDESSERISYGVYINGKGYWARAYQDGEGDWTPTTVKATTTRTQVTLDGKNKKLSIRGPATYDADITTTISRQSNVSLYLMGNHEESAINLAKMKMYACKIYKDGTIIRDFVPVKRNSDGVIGLFDLVRGNFYLNAGTGSFTAGSTVSSGVKYENMSKYLAANKTLTAKWTSAS